MYLTITFRKVILEAVILTSVVVVSLTLITFWAAKRGYDFNFLGPFLFGALMVLIVFSFIQIFFPLGKMSVMIYVLGQNPITKINPKPAGKPNRGQTGQSPTQLSNDS
nr:BI1-like protein [Tanacetum cinerariifolium]